MTFTFNCLAAKAFDLICKKTGVYRWYFFASPVARCFSAKQFQPPFGFLELPKNDFLENASAGVGSVAPGTYTVFGNTVSRKNIPSQSSRWWWQSRSAPGDPKDFWEIARGWQWLRAYEEARTVETREAVLQEVYSFLKDNPYPRGLAWAVGLDVAIRGINLLYLYLFSQNKDLLPHLWQHRCYLKKMLWLSKNAIRNNHYLGELAVLAILEEFFQHPSAAKRTKNLEREIPRQFYPDGVNEEQSIRYHKFSLEFVLLARRFLDISLPKDFLEKAGEFLVATMRADRSWPSIGDDDMGCVLRLHHEPLHGDYLALLSVLACLTGRGDFKQVAQKLYPEAHLLVPSAEERWHAIEPQEPKEFYLFPQGGYAIAHNREREQGVLLKFGPHKWHAHADLLHLELWHRGVPVFVDSGTYRYNNVPQERRYFRSTPAHNTLTFDGGDQTRQLTTFRWGRPSQTEEPLFSREGEGLFFQASYRGYGRKNLNHTRILQYHPKDQIQTLEIRDLLSGSAQGPFEIFWHMAPGLCPVLDPSAQRFQIFLGQERTLLVELEMTSEIPLKLSLEETPYSPYYGNRATQLTLRIRAFKNDTSVEVRTHITFFSVAEAELHDAKV